ncbi:hypothetical protein D3C72_2059140 [compost metagenome]
MEVRQRRQQDDAGQDLDQRDQIGRSAFQLLGDEGGDRVAGGCGKSERDPQQIGSATAVHRLAGERHDQHAGKGEAQPG